MGWASRYRVAGLPAPCLLHGIAPDLPAHRSGPRYSADDKQAPRTGQPRRMARVSRCRAPSSLAPSTHCNGFPRPVTLVAWRRASGSLPPSKHGAGLPVHRSVPNHSAGGRWPPRTGQPRRMARVSRYRAPSSPPPCPHCNAFSRPVTLVAWRRASGPFGLVRWRHGEGPRSPVGRMVWGGLPGIESPGSQLPASFMA